MTDRIVSTQSSPSTTFVVEGDLLSQSVAGNFSTVRCYLRAVNGPGGSTASGYSGAGFQAGTVVGVKEFGRRSATPFLPSGYKDGATRWRLGPYDVQVPHNADGTRAAITFGMVLQYGNVNTTLFSNPLSLPTIPRASKATFSTGAAFDAGAAVTINTNRASSSFTHRLTLSFQGIYEVLAENVTTGFAWTPPLSLLEKFPDAASATGFIRTETFSGATSIGRYDTVFTLRAPATATPTVASINAQDLNSDVSAAVGLMVQGLSRPSITPVGTGIYGSTIKSGTVTLDGVTLPAGSEFVLAKSGPLPVAATVTDSRGRTGSGAATLNVLAYRQPAVTGYQARRCSSIGALQDDGAYLRVDLSASIASLVNGTQRNALTIRAFTRPRDGTVWTPRNVITQAGLTYGSWFLVSGGAAFGATSSWDVRVQVHDKFGVYVADTTVSTARVTMDWGPDGVGVGKIREQGALDVAGQIFQNGRAVIDAGGSATADQVRAGVDSSRFVTPASLRGGLELPDQVWLYGVSAFTLTGGASSWHTVTSATVDFTPPRDLWVDIQGGAVVKAASGGGYVMVGLNLSGGLNLTPDSPPDGGTPLSHLTPFSSSTVDTHITTPVKRVRLPGGVTTTVALWTRRNVSSGVHTCNYAFGSIRPVRWA